MKNKKKLNNKKNILNPYYTNLYLSGGAIASGVTNAVGQAIQSGIQAGQIADTSKIEENIKAASTANIGENAKSTNDLTNAWDSINWQSGTNFRELYGDPGQRTAQAFLGMTQGATSGKGLFGRGAGILGSAIGTIFGSLAALVKANKKAKEINEKVPLANANQLSAFQNSAANLAENTNLNALSSYAAEGGKIYIKPSNRGKFTESAKRAGMGVQEFANHVLANKENYSTIQIKRANFAKNASKWKHADGGSLFTNGGQFDNGVTYIDEGGTHEENMYDGVPQGIAPDGNPNLVEEGEVIYNDYVYSNRLKPDKKLLEAYNLPSKYKNKTFAEIANDLSKESKERQYDPISKRGLEDNMSKLQQAQDKFKEIRKQKQLDQLMSKLTDEDLSLLSEMAQQQQPQQTMFDLGGIETLASNIQGFDVQPIQTPDVQQVSNTLTNTVNNTASKPFNLSYLNNDNISEQIADTLGQITGAIASAAKQNNAESYRNLNKKGIVPAFAEGGHLFDDGGNEQKDFLRQLSEDFASNLYQKEEEKGLADYMKTADSDYMKLVKTLQELELDDEEADNQKRLEESVRNLPTKFDFLNNIDEIKVSEKRRKKTDPLIEYAEKELPKEINKRIKQQNWDTFKERLKNPEILRALPIGVKGAMALSDALGWTNKTDYSNPNLITKYTRTIGAPTIGNYMSYNPLDPNYIANQQRQQTAATRNAIMNASMGNAGTAMAGLLANSYAGQIAEGDAYRKAMEENLKQRQLVEDFNRGTNIQNAQMMLDADKANQRTLLDSGTQQAMMREKIDEALSGARSANLDNFLASLGDMGKEAIDKNTTNTLIERTGVPGGEDFKRKYGGKIKKNKKSKYFKTL